MAYLFINTACHPRGIAIAHESAVMSSYWWSETNQDSWQIFSFTERLFIDAGISMSDLCGIIIVNGPGSFTGIRVGITVANAMAYAHALPVYAVTTGDFLWSCFPGGKDGQMGREVGFVWSAGVANNYFSPVAGKAELVAKNNDKPFTATENLEPEELVKNLPSAMSSWLKMIKAVKVAVPFYLKPAGVTESKKANTLERASGASSGRSSCS